MNEVTTSTLCPGPAPDEPCKAKNQIMCMLADGTSICSGCMPIMAKKLAEKYADDWHLLPDQVKFIPHQPDRKSDAWDFEMRRFNKWDLPRRLRHWFLPGLFSWLTPIGNYYDQEQKFPIGLTIT